MEFNSESKPEISYIEIYTPMAKLLAYWHVNALGFRIDAFADADTGSLGYSSYLLVSGQVRLLLTSGYSLLGTSCKQEIQAFLEHRAHGVKRIVFKVDSVKEYFDNSISAGAIPIHYPNTVKDSAGSIEQASIKLFDESEIVYLDDSLYNGKFRPGYVEVEHTKVDKPIFTAFDHIASEVRSNEMTMWCNYLKQSLNLNFAQSFERGPDNRTGMALQVCQSDDRKITMVVAEPLKGISDSKILKNINMFGPGVHHIAFSCTDIVSAVQSLTEANVNMVSFPKSYYQLLRQQTEFKDLDIDLLEKHQILVDKEGDGYLLQKFIKPISDRPFFLYEMVQRINGYNGFAIGNINVLKKAEEMEIMRV